MLRLQQIIIVSRTQFIKVIRKNKGNSPFEIEQRDILFHEYGYFITLHIYFFIKKLVFTLKFRYLEKYYWLLFSYYLYSL